MEHNVALLGDLQKEEITAIIDSPVDVRRSIEVSAAYSIRFLLFPYNASIKPIWIYIYLE